MLVSGPPSPVCTPSTLIRFIKRRQLGGGGSLVTSGTAPVGAAYSIRQERVSFSDLASHPLPFPSRRLEEDRGRRSLVVVCVGSAASPHCVDLPTTDAAVMRYYTCRDNGGFGLGPRPFTCKNSEKGADRPFRIIITDTFVAVSEWSIAHSLPALASALP